MNMTIINFNSAMFKQHFSVQIGNFYVVEYENSPIHLTMLNNARCSEKMINNYRILHNNVLLVCHYLHDLLHGSSEWKHTIKYMELKKIDYKAIILLMYWHHTWKKSNRIFIRWWSYNGDFVGGIFFPE